MNSGTITSRFEAQIWARSRRSQAVLPGGGRDPLRARRRRLGIPSGSPAKGGAPGERERAARVRDLSEEATLLTQPPPPPVLYGETDVCLGLVHLPLHLSTCSHTNEPTSMGDSR